MKKNKAVKVVEKKDGITKAGFSMETLIMKAVERDASVETLERILAMRRELKAELAKEQYDQAMAKFQSECPEIKKTKEVKDRSGRLLYAYAPIESIVKQVKEILAKNGLSYSIKTEVNGKVKSICTIHHIAGHSEESEMEVPLGVKTAIMSDSQAVAAAATFSKRYAFMNALGIMTGDDDTDGAVNEAPPTEIEEAKEKLEKCMTISSLKKVWSGFSKEIKGNREIIICANEIKSNIQNENTQKN